MMTSSLRTRRTIVAVSLAGTFAAGCGLGGIKGPPMKVSPPSELCRDRSLAPGSFCLPARRVEGLLRHGKLRILAFRETFGGMTNPQVLQLAFGDKRSPLVLLAKWKAAPHGSADGTNNNPRREIAAYALQKLFLDPDDYVVPPTVARCLSRREIRRIRESAKPTMKGTKCVLGVLSYWLQGVTQKRVYDVKRFHRDIRYRGHMANFNLFTYLIDHRDSRAANRVVAKDSTRPRVFAVDNGLSFGSWLKNPAAFFTTDWSNIFVSALPRRSVERLRKLTLATLRRRLTTVSELRATHGLLQPVAPTFTGTSPQGVRRHGAVVQLGLTRKEIDAVNQRRLKLLRRVDMGKIRLF